MSTIQLPEPILDATERAYAISSLWQGTPANPNTPEERRLLNLVLPPWQRPVVWTEAQQVRFIEGIFLGLGTGYYVVNGRDYEYAGADKPMSGWLIDGQQRITAIARFIADEIAIFGGVHYSDLSIGEKRRRFDNLTFPCFELGYEDDESKLKVLYHRLNFSGIAHTQEDLQRLGAGFISEYTNVNTIVTNKEVRS
jgi:hypothetical protein